ncbi:CopG family ribbon-helix-helix protein [Caldimonas brevitalea]|uniref:CopG family transcriptional regulator n=1 Tax=Caldimonas brevitalea TaxID=413882 RepID=A0A0G3BC78_9BURK|nr:CopG family ribbon-helix-helix protein [Caldimonas brevitalea]AKJ26917.1 CopG family transcriptional regulator [Caldimonas brevitalea]
MTTAGVRPVAVKIDDDLKERIQRLAQARARTPHWIMKEAISQYVEREEKHEAFRQAGLKAWEEYRATGQYARPEEVEAWLESWGTEDEQPAPECRK